MYSASCVWRKKSLHHKLVLSSEINDNFLTVLSCRSPGFGISLVAETTTGSMLSVQTASAPAGEGQSVVPEDLGKQAAEMLLEEIYRVSHRLKRNLALQFYGNFARKVV